MFELPSPDPSDAEPQPESDPEPPSLYLVESMYAPDAEPIEYRAGHIRGGFERAASNESIAAIVQSVKSLTEPREGVPEKYVFRREKILPGPLGSTVHLNEYGFFGNENSPAGIFYKNEPDLRMAGIEIHFPVADEDENTSQLATETYLIEADQDGAPVLRRCTYDDVTDTEEVYAVNEKGATALLALLAQLQNQ